MNQVENGSPETTLINECLDALLYQDVAFRPLTHNTLTLIENAKKRMSGANASLIEGIRLCKFDCEVPFKLYVKAEEMGCKHPVLYYLLGECYSFGVRGVDGDVSKALECYEKAIAGGCGWGLLGRCILRSSLTGGPSQHKENVQHLFDIEREGHIDGFVLNEIADRYRYDYGSSEDVSMAMVYYQRAIDHGYAYAAVSLRRLQYPFVSRTPNLPDKGMLLLLEAENKGLGMKDDRILDEIIKMLADYSVEHNPHPDILGSFKNKCEMALHYCDVLIARKSPLGFQNKARIYEYGLIGIEKDMLRAVSIREEAANVGLADRWIYKDLQSAYWYGRGVPINGLKVLEYCEKELQVLPSDCDILSISRLMASVYEEGIKPVKKDGRKVVECYERVLRIVASPEKIARLYDHMANVYVRGVKPISRNGAKALECYIRGSQSGYEGWCRRFYSGIIDVYEAGIPPIARNRTLAAEIGRIMARVL